VKSQWEWDIANSRWPYRLSFVLAGDSLATRVHGANRFRVSQLAGVGVMPAEDYPPSGIRYSFATGAIGATAQ